MPHPPASPAKRFKYEEIRDRILVDSEIAHSSRLPSERDLCTRFRISRNTARKALALLCAENAVVRSVGRGTFLQPAKLRRRILLLLPTVGPELLDHLQQEARTYAKAHPNTGIAVVSAPREEFIRILHEAPGAKIALCPNAGYLAALRLLAPLNELPGFGEATRQLLPSATEWLRLPPLHTPNCYSLPLAMEVNVCGLNRRIVEALGLDAERGPRELPELHEWLRQAAARPDLLGHMAIAHFPDRQQEPPTPPVGHYVNHAQGWFFLTPGDPVPSFDYEFGPAWLRQFRELYRIGPQLHATGFATNPLIAGDTLYSYRIGPWFIAQAARHPGTPPILLFPAPPPRLGQDSYTQRGSTGLALLEDGVALRHDRDSAWDFMQFLCCDPGSQERMCQRCSFLSPQREVFAAHSQEPAWQVFTRTFANAIPRCDHPVQHGITKTVRNYFYPCVYGEIDVAEAVARTEETARLLLEIERDRTLF